MFSKFRVLNGEKIREIYRDYQEKLKNVVPIVVLCGPGKCEEGSCEDCPDMKKNECMYHIRLSLAEQLTEQNCLPVIFEEELDLEIASIEETIILRNKEVDIVIVFPNSKGSAAELAFFARDNLIRPKLVVFVQHQFHPLYSDSESFLTSVYKELMSILGHVYPYDLTGKKHPTPLKIISLLMYSYRLNKVLGEITT